MSSSSSPSSSSAPLRLDALIQQIARKKFGGGGGGGVATTSTTSTHNNHEEAAAAAARAGRPADAAAAATGRALCAEFLAALQQLQHKLSQQQLGVAAAAAAAVVVPASDEDDTDNAVEAANKKKREVIQDKVLRVLLVQSIHPSIPQAFFDALVNSIKKKLSGITTTTTTTTTTAVNRRQQVVSLLQQQQQFDFLAKWVLQMQQDQPGGGVSPPPATTLAACIRAYAWYLAATTTTDSTTTTTAIAAVHRKILDVYQRLAPSATTTTRQLVARETMHAALSRTCTSTSSNISSGSSSSSSSRSSRGGGGSGDGDGDDSVALSAVTRLILSPVLASTLLQLASNNKNADNHDSSLLLMLWNYLQRQIWYHWSGYSGPDQRHWLEWSMRVVDLFMMTAASSSSSTSSSHHFVVVVTVVEQMWLDWIEWAIATDDAAANVDLLRRVLEVYLPRFLLLHSSNNSGSLLHNCSAIVDAVTDLCGQQQQQQTDATLTQQQLMLLSPLACLRLTAFSLATVNSQERLAVLNLLTVTVCSRSSCNNNETSGHPEASRCVLLAAAASILPHVDPENCHEVAVELRHALSSVILKKGTKAQPSVPPTYNNLIEFFGVGNIPADASFATTTTTTSNALVYRLVAGIRSFSGTNFSSRQQTAALLFGICLLEDPPDTKRNMSDRRFDFLNNLLVTYPHLAVQLLSVLTEKIDQASRCIGQDGEVAAAHKLLCYLEFMCESLASNSHCAQEIWSLVGVQWMQPLHSPLTLRIALVRLFPKLVAGNKRLYRRVVDYIGVCLGSKEAGMRLAAAATLADLTADDNIRDVTDVIGWIQTLLTVDCSDSPIHTLLVHYALISLHYLVVAQELDFDVVIKVLNKKLCSVSDHAAILKKPLVVLEALVLLLGDGECGGYDDSSDDDDDDGKKRLSDGKLISPQVTAAVRALLHVGQAARVLQCKDASSKLAVNRIRRNVFVSLSKYSLQALGVDDDGLKLAVTGAFEDEVNVANKADNIYVTLRDLVVAEMSELPVDADQEKETSGLIDLAARLVEFEEEVLGSTLWQKRGRSQRQSASSQAPKRALTPEKIEKSPFDVRSILPQLSNVQEMADKGPSPATSIAMLLSSDGSKLSLLRDHADSSLEVVSDPLLLMLCVQGYLHTASRLLTEQPQTVGGMLSEMNSWYDVFVSPDAMYLALSCFSIFLPFELQEDGSEKTCVEVIYDTVMTAFKSNYFEKGDVANICIGLLGVSSLRYANLERINDIVGQLEQTVRGYGGEQTFGAYYGLALIAQACPTYLPDDVKCQLSSGEIKKLISRIDGFILEDLVACFENGGDAIVKLVSSTKRGKVSSTLIDSVLNLGPNSVPLLMTKQAVARYLFLSCAVCFPALASVNSYLLLAVFRFLESLEWGSGKGVALPSVIRACQGSGVMKDELLQQVHSDYSAAFESSANQDGIEDIFFALRGVRWTASPDAVYELPAANRKLIDDNGSVLSLVASVMSIASLSCFGTTRLEALCHLDESIADDDINEVVELMLKSITIKGDSKRSDVGTILMGLLSAIGDSETRDDDDDDSRLSPDKAEPFDETAKKIAPDAELSLATASMTHESVILLDFTKLPSPQLGTVLDGVRGIIERLTETASGNSQHDVLLSRALRSLQRISIPEKYANGFLEPLLRDNVARDAGVALLCSQISMRRRAYSDGRSFATFAAQICVAPNEAWHKWLGHGSTPSSFVEKLADIGPKLPVDSLKECLANIWDRCLTSKDPASSNMVDSFLSSINHLLASTAVSPRAMQVLREFTYGKMFADIHGMQLNKTLSRSDECSSTSVLDLYVRCVKEVPHSNLDDIRFFRLSTESPEGFDVEAFRAIVVLELIKLRYFDLEQREVKELTNVASWFSKSILASSEQGQRDTYRRVACAFSSAMVHELSAAKRDKLTAILDLLLLTDANNCQTALEWLAVVAASWSAGLDSNGDLSLGYLCSIEHAVAQSLPTDELDQFFRIMVNDLPNNLAAIARREKMSGPISNQLNRSFKLWTDVGIDKHTLDCVQRAIICCHGSATSEDVFVTLVSSILGAVS